MTPEFIEKYLDKPWDWSQTKGLCGNIKLFYYYLELFRNQC
jgi:hypothetical protein